MYAGAESATKRRIIGNKDAFTFYILSSYGIISCERMIVWNY